MFWRQSHCNRVPADDRLPTIHVMFKFRLDNKVELLNNVLPMRKSFLTFIEAPFIHNMTADRQRRRRKSWFGFIPTKVSIRA